MPTLTLILIFAAIIALTLLARWYNSPQRKGKVGEVRVSEQLLSLSPEYHVLNDIVLKTDHGTTQIDHVVVSKYGVFTIETKNYRGEIYGDDNRKEWTQIIVTEVRYQSKWYKTYTYVTKYQFYNPVKQSIGHAMQIKSLLNGYNHIHVVPIVAFAGSAVLTNVESRNHVVYDYELPSLIQNYKSIYLSDDDVARIVDLLAQNNLREMVDNKTHVKNLRAAEKQVHDTIKSGICPKCGGSLIKRNGRYGSFYGCSNYPNCKFTVKQSR